MARSVIMPKTGMAMEEGTIVRWLKKPGDTVTRGEPIAVIETDKVTMELEAEDTGTLLGIVHGDGTVVKATHAIAWIGVPGEKIEAAPVQQEPGSPHGATAAATPTGQAPGAPVGTPLATVSGRVPATPAARRLAAEAGLELSTVKGSGPGGAVRARDVAGAAGAAPAPVSGTPLPMTGMRRAIADKMLRSHQSVPSVTLVTRADVSELSELRAKINGAGGPKVSFTDFVVRAVATALREQPLLNSFIDGDRVVLRDEVNVGVAVALDAGLIVPVIRGADHLGVRQISEKLRGLSAGARAGSLVPADYAGGTFTVTNLGMYGITEFTPLINVPESAILGVGAIEEVLRRGADGTIVSRQLMSLCLTHDHRHIDGAPAAVFLSRVKALLENCWSLLA